LALLNYKIHKIDDSYPWLTLVHGAGGSSTIWYKQIKPFIPHFNLLLVDLRGHGQSKYSKKIKTKYTFQAVSKDVMEVLDKENIQKSHFAGISLGTIIIRQLAEDYPDRVQSMIMGGAVMKLDFRSQLLMKLGVVFKSLLPYLVLYRLFAFIILPKKNHKASRNLFIREAKKLYRKEFLRWFKLTSEINPLLKFFRNAELPIPTLYIMGEEDYLFLPSVKKIVDSAKNKYSKLFVVPKCGHVVNVEKPQIFNQTAIDFINGLATNN
jgi:pimeloyl-ACP methyl ester carboxylesterase